ncbi:MAG: MFS transporter [Stellaceae bacterium]
MMLVAPARLAVAWVTMFLVGTELFVFSPLLPLLAADYHISTALAGLSVTIFSLAYMFGAPILGQLCDRFGRRRVLLCSLIGFTTANWLTASAGNLLSLLIIRLLAGVAAAGISPSIYALVSSAAAPERRATWLAIVVSGLLVALALGASTGGFIGAWLGWHSVFTALGGLSLLFGWLNLLVWPPDCGAAANVEAARPYPIMKVGLARRLLPMVIWSTGLYGVYTYLGAGLIAVGFSTAQTAQAILLYGCGSIAGVLIGGRLADRLGVRFTAGASFAGLCACLLVLREALNTGKLVEPALGVSSAVAQLFFPAQQAGLANDFPGERGMVMAWNNSALFFGISLGSVLGGQAIALGFDANLTIAAGLALVGCIVNAIVVPGRATPA